jgi:hypothetical protein
MMKENWIELRQNGIEAGAFFKAPIESPQAMRYPEA